MALIQTPTPGLRLDEESISKNINEWVQFADNEED